MKMKKSIVLLIVLLAFCKNACAQGLTATLQSGDQLSVYYGVNAFVSAYEAANDGDVITLSAGTFNAPTVVEKSLRITGVGAFEETGNTVFSSLTVKGTNCRIEGVTLTKLRLSNQPLKRGAVLPLYLPIKAFGVAAAAKIGVPKIGVPNLTESVFESLMKPPKVRIPPLLS